MKLFKLLLAAMGATVLLGALVSSASARNFEFSAQTIRAIFERVEFHFPERTARCEVVLEGSLHNRTMPKVMGSLIGYITEARVNICEMGAAVALRTTLPWHIRYSGFTGSLPDITSIIMHIINAGWSVRIAGGECLFRSTAANPIIASVHRDVAEHVLNVSLGGSIRTANSFECLGERAISIRSDNPFVTVLNAFTRIRVSLI